MKTILKNTLFLLLISMFSVGCIFGGSGDKPDKPESNEPNPEVTEPGRQPSGDPQAPEPTAPEVTPSFNDTVQIN